MNPNIDKLLAGLSPQKRALYEKMLAKKREARRGPPPIPRRDTDLPAPLSFAQQRMWLIDRLAGSSAYNIPVSVLLSGPLDTDALERAFREIVRRHEILRTTFAVADGEPVQVIHPCLDPAIEYVNLGHLSGENQKQALDRQIRKAAARDFDLETGPLLHVLFIDLGQSELALILTLHHIIADGWTNSIFLKELAALYAKELHPGTPPLPRPEIQYADFAVYQRDRLRGELREKLLTYWKAGLSGELPQIQLPFDHPRPAMADFAGNSLGFEIPARLNRSFTDIARSEGATRFMTMLGAFGALLGRYSGQTDILIGTPIANRNHPQTENLIGFFANTLVPRLDLSAKPSFRDLLKKTRTTMLEAQDHQDLPFEMLVEELQPRRDMSRNPIFQVLFAVHNRTQTELDLDIEGVRMRWLHLAPDVSQVDLSLSLVEDDHGGLTGAVIYPTALFDRTTIVRFSAHFLSLLQQIAAQPDRELGSLPLLSDRERRQILREWNQTEETLPGNNFLDLFEQGREHRPDGTAVILAGSHRRILTYECLDRHANRLAHRLRELGAGPGTLIAMALPRSAEMVLAMPAVLKTGAAYIPLDLKFPAERLAYMLEDSSASLVLASGESAILPSGRIPTMSIDNPKTELEPYPSHPPDCPIDPRQLAYVIYTSGSTGKPKGVQIPHGALANFLTAMRKSPGLTRDDTLLSVTTVSFDIAHLELYLPLIAGGKMVLADERATADGTLLARLIQDMDVTVMQATPATWRMLLLAGWQGKPDLKIFCGGEALPANLARDMAALGASLWNMYGPTETTIWSSIFKVEPNISDREDGASAVALGKPIANTQIYILDPCLNPAPIGVSGELHIGGSGLARGYLKLPAITAEKFIPDPFTAVRKGVRLYRTGDLARYLVSGNIEYLGRIDHQVKLRGFRIELGDIETALTGHREIREAVVLLGDRSGEKQLTAYLVLNEQWVHDSNHNGSRAETIDREKWAGFLADKLPAYMVPAWFVRVTGFPLTPNGKIDRRALSGPEWSPDPTARSVYEPPRNNTETELTEIWRNVLAVDRIGIRDDFFALGGHSLLAVQLVVQIQETFHIHLAPARLFDHTTIASLANLIDMTRSAEKLIARHANPGQGLEAGEI